MKNNKKKLWLCVEHGCKFVIEAESFQEAYDGAMEYGGHVVGIYNENTGKTQIASELTWG